MTVREKAWIRDSYGTSQPGFLERVGMVGEDVVLVHCSAMDADDAAGLAGTGTHVVHCPTGPAKMGSGVTPCTSCTRPASTSRSAPTPPRPTTAPT